MKLARDRADATGELHLHVHVDVFVRGIPLDGLVAHIGGDGTEAVADGVSLLARQQARALQARDVGERAGDILDRQLDIDLDGAPEVGRVRIRFRCEAATPGLHRLALGVGQLDRQVTQHGLGPGPGRVVAGSLAA